MTDEFESIHNHNEAAVFDRVRALASSYPALADDPNLLADVACVALNRLQPRYIRHTVDFRFYLGEKERLQLEQSLDDAVEVAFGYVQARNAMRARG